MISVVIELHLRIRFSTFEAFILPAFSQLVKGVCPTNSVRIFASSSADLTIEHSSGRLALGFYRSSREGEIGSFVLSGLDSTAFPTAVKGILGPLFEEFFSPLAGQPLLGRIRRCPPFGIWLFIYY